MQIQDMLTLYNYNYWANKQILAAAKNVSQEQLVAPAAYDLGTLRRTLLHTLDTEYGWRVLCQHATSTPVMTEEEFPTLDALEQRWREDERAMRDYLASLTDADLAGLIGYTLDNGERRERVLWHCLVHVVNHGTQHRSEAAAILTGYGHSPGDLDFLDFLRQQG
jgi:uncharacterized damage-inducible protein DinB